MSHQQLGTAADPIQHTVHTPFFSKLTVKLIALIVVLTIAFLTAGYYLFLQFTNEFLRRSIGEETVLVVQQTLARINDAVIHRIEFFEAYAHDPQLIAYLQQNNSTFGERDDRDGYIAETDATWSTRSPGSITPLMQEIIANPLSQELRALSEFFTHKYGTNVFPEVILTNAYGINIAQTGPTTDYYQADEEWWQRSVAEGVYIDQIDLDESAGVEAMDVGIPVYAEDGSLQGVFKIILGLEEVTAIVERMTPDAKTNAEHLSHGHESHESLHLSLVGDDGMLIYSDSPYATPEILLQYQHVFKEARTSYYYTYELDAEEKLVALASIDIMRELHTTGPDRPSQYWTLVFDQNAADVLVAPATSMREFMLIIALLFVLMISLFMLFITRSVTLPLAHLTVVANELAHGNMGVRAKSKGKGEISRLVRVFNYMVERVRDAQAGLEEKVAQRTKELQDSHDMLTRKNEELERVNKTMVGRELKMMQLKEEIAALEEQLRKEQRS